LADGAVAARRAHSKHKRTINLKHYANKSFQKNFTAAFSQCCFVRRDRASEQQRLGGGWRRRRGIGGLGGTVGTKKQTKQHEKKRRENTQTISPLPHGAYNNNGSVGGQARPHGGPQTNNLGSSQERKRALAIATSSQISTRPRRKCHKGWVFIGLQRNDG